MNCTCSAVSDVGSRKVAARCEVTSMKDLTKFYVGAFVIAEFFTDGFAGTNLPATFFPSRTGIDAAEQASQKV